jgi:Carboxypeptidase regulatory-like domain
MRLSIAGVFLVALLPAVPAVHSGQAPSGGAVITGRVFDADTQAPIAGAHVTLVGPLDRRPAGPPGPPTQTETGDDGVYAFSNIAAGEYHVQATKSGFIFTPANRLTIVVGEGKSDAVSDLSLRRGAAITGRILDARGEGLADVSVRAVRPARGNGPARALPVGAPGQGAQTNDIGEFRITGLPDGDYYLAASPRPRSAFEQGSISGGTSPTTTFYPGSREMSGGRTITVAVGQTVSGIEFTMISARGFAVSGVVVDETGQTVGNGVVSSLTTAPVLMGPPALSRTRPDGTFTIGNLTPGTYRLTASVLITVSTGNGGFSTSSSSPGSAPLSVTVGDGDVVGVTLVVQQRR